MNPLERQTLPRLNLLPDKDLVDLCPHIEAYQVPKSLIIFK